MQATQGLSLRWGAIACVLSFASAVHATSVPRLSFEELTDKSEVIATGQVTRSWTDWDATHQHIWTHYEVAVSTAYKGQTAPTVVISEPGGVVGNLGMRVAGSVAYQPGDSVFVFLQRMPNGFLRTTGWGQGQYRVDQRGRLHASESLKAVDLLPASSHLVSLEGTSLGEMAGRVAARIRVRGNQ
jgi:hypothetical protein